MFVIVSRHPAFGKLFLGCGRPVASKKQALNFLTRKEAEERIAFWQGLAEKDKKDLKFFRNLVAERA